LETSKDGDYTTSLGGLFHCFTILVLGKKIHFFPLVFFIQVTVFFLLNVTPFEKPIAEQKSNTEK